MRGGSKQSFSFLIGGKPIDKKKCDMPPCEIMLSDLHVWWFSMAICTWQAVVLLELRDSLTKWFCASKNPHGYINEQTKQWQNMVKIQNSGFLVKALHHAREAALFFAFARRVALWLWYCNAHRLEPMRPSCEEHRCHYGIFCLAWHQERHFVEPSRGVTWEKLKFYTQTILGVLLPYLFFLRNTLP